MAGLASELSAARAAGDLSKVERLQDEIRASEERSAVLSRQLESTATEVDRLREVAASAASESTGASGAERRELEALRSKQEQSFERFQQEIQAAVEGRLSAERLVAANQAARDESERATRAAQKALENATKEAGTLKIALVVVGVVVIAAFATILIVVGRGGGATTPAPTSAAPTKSITLQSLTDPVRLGDKATLKLTTWPSAGCNLDYFTPAGTKSAAEGLGVKSAANNGTVSWTWLIDDRTKPSTGTVKADCEGARFERKLEIRGQ